MLNNLSVQAGIAAVNFLLLGLALWNLSRVARKSKRPPPDSEFWE